MAGLPGGSSKDEVIEVMKGRGKDWKGFEALAARARGLESSGRREQNCHGGTGGQGVWTGWEMVGS